MYKGPNVQLFLISPVTLLNCIFICFRKVCFCDKGHQYGFYYCTFKDFMCTIF
jgi:hypothetical protein